MAYDGNNDAHQTTHMRLNQYTKQQRLIALAGN
jgi:hypothetical protein